MPKLLQQELDYIEQNEYGIDDIDVENQAIPNYGLYTDEIITGSWNEARKNIETFKQKYSFLSDFIENPDKIHKDFNHKINFVYEQKEYDESILSKIGEITLGEHEADGIKYFVVSKNNKIKGIPYGILDNEGNVLETAHKNVGSFVDEDTEYILINLYTDNRNDNTLYIMNSNV